MGNSMIMKVEEITEEERKEEVGKIPEPYKPI